MTTRTKTGRQIGIMSACHAFQIRRNARETGRDTGTLAALSLLMSTFTLLASFAMAKQKPPATKTISGQVLDASSHGISGATVLLTDLQTHKTNAIYSSSGGNYNFSGLTAYHDYEVQARYQGQTSSSREVSSMDPRLLIVVNLTVGSTGSHGSADDSQ